MTALTEYDRLECPGLWRASPLDQRREIVVGLSDRSLVLSDPKTDMAVVHWSLAALSREGDGAAPAIFRPGADNTETLELDDTTMITALDRVIRSLERRKPHPGRLRGFIFGAVTVSLGAACLFWLPGVLTRQTAAILPEPNRAELGQMVLSDLERLTGSPCSSALGQRAASALSERLLGKGGGRIMVMRDGLQGALALPGGLVLLSRDLVEAQSDPEIASGYVLAALVAQGGVEAQTVQFLSHAGLIATFRLLTTGTLPEGSMDGIGEGLVAQSAQGPQISAPDLLALFESAQFSPKAYAQGLNGASELSAALIAGDPFAGLSARPVLDDGNWVSLQAICQDG
jgi:hypothetical protein